MATADQPSSTTHQVIPYSYHSGNIVDEAASRACLALASLFTDDTLPSKAVPFMKTLGTPLMVDGTVMQLTGLRLEVAKGEVGYQLMLQRVGDRTIYLMAFPHYPLLTRLHADNEPTCRLQHSTGTSATLVHLLELVEFIHPLRGHRAAPMCLEAAKHINRMAKQGFRDGLSLTVGVETLVVAKGQTYETEETVYATRIAGA